MYIEKSLAIGEVPLQVNAFTREVYLEGFLLERLQHLCPPGAEPTNFDPVNQLSVPGGAQNGGTGRIDLAFELRVGEDTVWAAVEVKVDRLGVEHLNQLLAYLQDKQALTSQLANRLEQSIEPCAWMGILAGQAIEPDLAHALVKGTWRSLEGVKLPDGDPPEIGAVVIKRFREPHSGSTYVFADKYFANRPASSQRDFSRFSFDDGANWYGAAAFVRACVAQFAAFSPGITVAELQAKFPRALQGSMEVVLPPHMVTDRRRYSKEVFSVGMEEFVVCTQWGYANGQGNLVRFIEAIKRLGKEVQRRRPDGITNQL